MTCSVAQTATGEPPVGRLIGKRGVLSTKEARDQHDERQRLTEVLIPQIPRLLTKYSADREKIIHLVTIPLHFQIEMYVSARLQTNLEELLDALDELIEKHVDDDVLKAVAELYYHLDSSPPISALVEGHKMKLIDGIAAFVRTSLQKFDDDVETGEEEEALFLSYIKRMAAFSGFLDLRHWDLWDMLLKVVSNYDK
uniref:Cohesin subunit SCC3/SA HEAT-repeats domain-containing protein n=1 Tax=Caenorhabditis japonica TaxID=281687 RepID=A0A8R1J029_CAEJA